MNYISIDIGLRTFTVVHITKEDEVICLKRADSVDLKTQSLIDTIKRLREFLLTFPITAETHVIVEKQVGKY